jgi:hypothetical protein
VSNLARETRRLSVGTIDRLRAYPAPSASPSSPRSSLGQAGKHLDPCRSSRGGINLSPGLVPAPVTAMKIVSVRSLLMLVSALAVVTWMTHLDTRLDPDLGIQTCRLSLPGAALWSLPLAVFLWLGVVLSSKLAVWGAKRLNRREGK